jgi:hypothetical protein
MTTPLFANSGRLGGRLGGWRSPLIVLSPTTVAMFAAARIAKPSATLPILAARTRRELQPPGGGQQSYALPWTRLRLRYAA